MNAVATAAEPPVAPPSPRPAFFDFDGQAWTPRRPSRSPWDRKATNGLSVAGLLMHVAEQVEAPAPMLPAHTVIDILRPVPFGPTLTRAEVTREGRKMQMVESYLLAGDEPVARARVLRVREAESPAVRSPTAHPFVEAPGGPSFFGGSNSLGDLIETRLITYRGKDAPEGVLWARFLADLAPGVPATPVVQAAMLSDVGSGLGGVVNPYKWNFANMDISLHLVRRPVGEWILVTAGGMLQNIGVGLTNMTLADTTSQFGRAHQTLFIEPGGIA